MKKLNEALLVSCAVLGDRKSFSQLVEVYQSPIRRLFFNLTRDEELSKDLAQDPFLKAWLNINSFRAAAKFSTWLYRIAYNTFNDHIRSNKSFANVDVETISDRIVIDTSSEMDLSIDFSQALKVLHEDEQVAMLLFYMEDMSIDKISKIMNCPIGTIKSHLHRGRKKIEKYLNY